MRRRAVGQWLYRRFSAALHGWQPPARFKATAEWTYWRYRHWREPALAGDHYAEFFTAFFGLTADFYRDKHLLDVGCGPRGSLEWATQAASRTGLDPLANRYRRLGTVRHGMAYVCAAAEAMPFADGAFDVVSCFNALDHVDDATAARAEMVRVLRPGGTLLLIADVHPYPTLCEPSVLGWDAARRFGLDVVSERHFEGDNMYKSLREGISFNHRNPKVRNGIMVAQLQRPLIAN